MAKANKKTIGQILKDFGVKATPKTIKKYLGLSNKDVFKSVQKKTKKGKQSFTEYFSNRVAKNPNSPFKAEEEEYQRTYGTPSKTVLKQKEKDFQGKAKEYYAPRFEDLTNTTAEQRRRIEEDSGLGIGTLEQEYQKQQQDITRQRQFAEQEFGAAQQQNMLQDQLQNESLIADINAATISP